MLRTILNQAMNRGAARRRPAAGTGTGTGTARRSQDEAIGRGVRGLLRRLRA